MTIDLTPILKVVLPLCAVALTTLGTWALQRLARRLGIQANNEAIQAFDEAIAKSVRAGASATQQMIAAKGYDHVEVKSAILAMAAPYAITKFGPALKGIGLDPNDVRGTTAYLSGELDRIFPTAMAPFAAAPTTPLAPLAVFPPGSMTTAQLNTASAAGG